MTQSFVPFSAAAPGVAPCKPGLPAKIVVDSKSAEAFRPLTESNSPARHAAPVVPEPKVTLERDGSRVTRIKLQCVCGHTIELTCE
jgi:hypothetical protein